MELMYVQRLRLLFHIMHVADEYIDRRCSPQPSDHAGSIVVARCCESSQLDEEADRQYVGARRAESP